MLRRGHAAVAAVDCATYGLAKRHAPALLAGVRVLHATAPAPGLPLIASRGLRDDQVQHLRDVLLSLAQDAPEVLRAVSIRRLHAMDLDDYAPIRQMEMDAAERGYDRLG